MSRLNPSSPQRPRGGAPLRGLPLATVVTLAGLALLAGRRGDGAARAWLSDADGRNTVVAAAPRGTEAVRAFGGPEVTTELAPMHGGGASARSTLAAAGSSSSAEAPVADGPGREGSAPGREGEALVSEGRALPFDSSRLDGLREEGSFHRGQRQGEWTFFDHHGFLVESGSYEAGERSGEWRRFSPNGQLVQLAGYVDGAQQGEWQRFSREGALVEEGQFEDSVPIGRWVRRYSNGSIKERGLYVEGLREGHWEFFDDLGRSTRRTGTYRAGVRID